MAAKIFGTSSVTELDWRELSEPQDSGEKWRPQLFYSYVEIGRQSIATMRMCCHKLKGDLRRET